MNGPQMSTQYQHSAIEKQAGVHGQFLRVEKYAVKTPRGKSSSNNITQIASEAMRVPGFCDHIERPRKPKIIFGVNPLEAANVAAFWSRQQTAQVFHKPSQCLLPRKFRSDKPCAVVGVVSVPPEWTEGENWSRFCDAVVTWLISKYQQDRLLSVVEHLEERCLHLHFWVVPRLGERFNSVHEGVKAVESLGYKASRGVKDAAYKSAMAQLQDEFHERVGKYFGMERQTIGRERYTRAQWQQKYFLDKKREAEFQRRIDEAVARALNELKLSSDDFADHQQSPITVPNY